MSNFSVEKKEKENGIASLLGRWKDVKGLKTYEENAD